MGRKFVFVMDTDMIDGHVLDKVYKQSQLVACPSDIMPGKFIVIRPDLPKFQPPEVLVELIQKELQKP